MPSGMGFAAESLKLVARRADSTTSRGTAHISIVSCSRLPCTSNCSTRQTPANRRLLHAQCAGLSDADADLAFAQHLIEDGERTRGKVGDLDARIWRLVRVPVRQGGDRVLHNSVRLRQGAPVGMLGNTRHVECVNLLRHVHELQLLTVVGLRAGADGANRDIQRFHGSS